MNDKTWKQLLDLAGGNGLDGVRLYHREISGEWVAVLEGIGGRAGSTLEDAIDQLHGAAEPWDDTPTPEAP